MDRTTLSYALSALARHFEDCRTKTWADTVTRPRAKLGSLGYADVYYGQEMFRELISAIYAADMAVSHADPRCGSELRAIAALCMNHLAFFEAERDRLNNSELASELDAEEEEGGAA